ncbi:MAG: S41 family peptidase, partial [Bacteroidota bacterium]
NYLEELIGIMQQNSLHRNTINWQNFKEDVFLAADGAETIVDTYPGVLKALELLGDNHSFLTTPIGYSLFSGTLSCDGVDYVEPDLPSTIGYVKVTGFMGPSSGDSAIEFVQSIQNQIRDNDNTNIVGWIVDLRNSGGGNMWPMLVGVGPVLGDGIAGYFNYPDDTFVSWGLQDGAAVIDGDSFLITEDSYQLFTPNPKVALLIDAGVASSGEAITVSFLNRPNTRLFGTATCGLSTSNESFALSDSATLFLTTAKMADRDQQVYGNEIQPDQFSSSQTIINDAIQWLEN